VKLPFQRLSLDMASTALPPAALPAWCLLNGVKLDSCQVQHIHGKGLGLIGGRASQSNGQQPLVSVPHNLVLSVEAVEQYAKQDVSFKQLYDAVGRQSTRRDVLLFLLVQLVMTRSGASRTGVPHPWTQYLAFLPTDVPLPTRWSPEERELLQGTSLEVRLCPLRVLRGQGSADMPS
jgi:hypothetical protein